MHMQCTQQCSTFRKKSCGQLAPSFSFFAARTSILVAKNYINGFSFVKDNGLSLVYVFPKKKVTYLGGQVGDQAWKFGRHWVKSGRIGDPTGRNVEPCTVVDPGRDPPSPLIFRPNWGPKSQKKIFETSPPPLYLRVWMSTALPPPPPHPFLKVWIHHWYMYLKFTTVNQVK